MDRYADQAEFIDFMNNETYGATYTYRLEDGDAFFALAQQSDPERTTFTIADGAGFVKVERRLNPGESALAVGCNSAPEKSILINIERTRLPTESAE